MKCTFAALAALFLFTSIGCTHHNLARNGGCRNCGNHQLIGGGGSGGGLLAGHHHGAVDPGPSGPPSASVAYPYYTVRGPRDFLMDNPPSIGR